MAANGVILVTGGTGNLGRRVVQRLRDSGSSIRVLSRNPRAPIAGVEYVAGDLEKDEGVSAALAGVDTVIHCAATGKIKEDTTLTRNLVVAAQPAGVRHLVNVSVVGADRIPVVSGVDRAMFAYFASQLAKERVIAESALPWTNLRATQFYDGFILLMLQGMAKLPVVPVPNGFRFQPVDTDEVAAMLVELALGRPVGQAPDIAGPRTYDADHLFRTYLEAMGKRRAIVHVTMPGGAAAAIRAGANLAPDRAVGRRTWEEFLAETVKPARPAVALPSR